MKELLQRFAAHNIWADQLIMDFILFLPEEKQKAEIPSSFNSLYATALHMWNGSSIWWQRLTTPDQLVQPATNFKGSMHDIVNGLSHQSQQWLDLISQASDESLNEPLHYKTLKGEPFSQPLKEIALHIFNHGTYHRGQLINMLRQLGIDGKLPQTDFALWARANYE
jgi:uncharacterized damage-inducible protein DinB